MMKEAQPASIFLSDYQAPDFLIDSTELYFDLHEDYVEVRSTLQVRRNPNAPANATSDLVLQGEGLELRELQLDGSPLASNQYQLDAEQLTVKAVPQAFSLQTVARCRPQDNKSLEGLYRSRGLFCTQCEAQGFRKITWYLDRPDVLSTFTTHIEADAAVYPVLLSNGNLQQREQLANGRTLATWQDPFPKPCYLFALVAGQLQCQTDTFTTMSGREISLELFVEKKDLDKCDHALTSLQAAMAWDESVYGREYDLDIYMIVAVDDFNMGAMENKGLNIFNTSCVLANPAITTDAGFQRIEAIIAHEYFHNWSGNRVTCRDWFQLSLKEGFTVFRDAQFSADMNSATVKRVEDVKLLRTMQFAEDAGPTAHPIQPQSYIEISNFYTLTVYEKGAEVVRMLHTLLGPEIFRKGSDLYFQRHDGEAATCEDFVAAMAEASGRDLSQFMRWYRQTGTPALHIRDDYDALAQRYTLTLEQSCDKAEGPLHIPVRMGLLPPAGTGVPQDLSRHDQVLELMEAKQTFTFEGVAERPVPSLLRGFSAPVKLDYPYSREQLLHIMQHDSDGFCRWDACQTLALEVLQSLVVEQQQGASLVMEQGLPQAYTDLLQNESLDKAMVALMLQLPSEAYLAEMAETIDIVAIHRAREFARRAIGIELQAELLAVYHANCCADDFKPEQGQIAQRSLKNQCLAYLAATASEVAIDLCEQQYQGADNMSDALAALTSLINIDSDRARASGAQALADFYRRWQHEGLVVNQWFQVQATCALPEALQRVRSLLQHPAYDGGNPNKVRALVGAFCSANPINFHQADGSSYQFLAEQVTALDADNPQLAARLLAPLSRWKRYPTALSTQMRASLERLSKQALSKDVFEIVSKSLQQ